MMRGSGFINRRFSLERRCLLASYPRPAPFECGAASGSTAVPQPASTIHRRSRSRGGHGPGLRPRSVAFLGRSRALCYSASRRARVTAGPIHTGEDEMWTAGRHCTTPNLVGMDAVCTLSGLRRRRRGRNARWGVVLEAVYPSTSSASSTRGTI